MFYKHAGSFVGIVNDITFIVDRRGENPALRTQRVKRAAVDECFNGFTVDLAGVRASAKIEQVRERAAFVTRFEKQTTDDG